ncbi:MAG: crossover junction endodeoxyribonuclease RuvC [Deltaproteobacteria bacterium]
MKIIGIDPGARVTGYGIVETTPKGLKSVAFGEITFEKETPISAVLFRVHQEVANILDNMGIGNMAIENIFLGKSIRSLITQAHTRGALILASSQMNIPVFEYSPLEIKKAVVGYGKAEKQQVQMMVKTILKIDEKMSFDTSDALAIAVCHAHSLQGKRL